MPGQINGWMIYNNDNELCRLRTKSCCSLCVISFYCPPLTALRRYSTSKTNEQESSWSTENTNYNSSRVWKGGLILCLMRTIQSHVVILILVPQISHQEISFVDYAHNNMPMIYAELDSTPVKPFIYPMTKIRAVTVKRQLSGHEISKQMKLWSARFWPFGKVKY